MCNFRSRFRSENFRAGKRVFTGFAKLKKSEECLSIVVRGRAIWDRKASHHPRTISVRVDLQASAQLPHPFPHASNTYTRLAGRCELRLLFSSYPFTPIFNGKFQHFGLVIDGHGCGRATRMAIDVCKRLLHNSKNRNLHFNRGG